MQKQPQRRNIITMTVKITTKQLFFTVILMFFVSHSPRFGIQEKKTESKTHTSKKVLVFHNCLNGCQVMQSGWLWAVTTSTTSLQIRTKHLILAARGTFFSDAAEDFIVGLPVWLADQGKNKKRINPNWFLCYIYCKLLSIWMASWWQFG